MKTREDRTARGLGRAAEHWIAWSDTGGNLSILSQAQLFLVTWLSGTPIITHIHQRGIMNRGID